MPAKALECVRIDAEKCLWHEITLPTYRNTQR